MSSRENQIFCSPEGLKSLLTMGAKKHGLKKDGMRAKYSDQVVPEQSATKDRRDALQKIYEANRFFGGILLISLSDLRVLPCAPHVWPKE